MLPPNILLYSVTILREFSLQSELISPKVYAVINLFFFKEQENVFLCMDLKAIILYILT